MPKERDYKREALLESPKRRRDRAARNKARRDVMRKLTEKHGKAVAERMMAGKDVDHKKPLSEGGSNNPSNWRLRDATDNRSDKHMFKGKRTTRPKNPERD